LTQNLNLFSKEEKEIFIGLFIDDSYYKNNKISSCEKNGRMNEQKTDIYVGKYLMVYALT
jgi:hypothetical protein